MMKQYGPSILSKHPAVSIELISSPFNRCCLTASVFVSDVCTENHETTMVTLGSVRILKDRPESSVVVTEARDRAGLAQQRKS